MRALISELKIMVHLGQHLNVVNLLGAVTKNIAQRKSNKVTKNAISNRSDLMDNLFRSFNRRSDGYR